MPLFTTEVKGGTQSKNTEVFKCANVRMEFGNLKI